MMVTILACSLAVNGPTEDAGVRDAIVAAVRERVSSSAQVQIERLRVAWFGGEPYARLPHDNSAAMPGSEDPGLHKGVAHLELIATPEPGARLQRDARFTLYTTRGRRLARVGTAVALVTAAVPHVRAARPIARGTILTGADVTPVMADPGPVRMRRLPELAEVVGSRAVRDVAGDEVISAAMVIGNPLVRSGDVVVTRVMSGLIDARGQAVAAQSGGRGDVIRVVNPSSRRAFKGRIIGSKEVEVIE